MDSKRISQIKFATGNRIRNGFMGFVIKLANLIKTKTDAMSDEAAELVSLLNPDWKQFVSTELEVSNERNARNLGGRTTSTMSDDDETN